jgi:hypothetical protein
LSIGVRGGGCRFTWSDRLVVLVAGRAGEERGVKVERPQPKARTYDLDATLGRRMLVNDGVAECVL